LPFLDTWDFCFWKRESCFVKVHLKTGRVIFGVFAKESAAMQSSKNVSIFLEAVVELDEISKVVIGSIEAKKNSGVYVNGDALDSVEFIPFDEYIRPKET
jgi:hypothetical protein